MALMRAGRQRVSAGPKDGGHGPTGQPAAALLGPAALTAASVGMWSAVLLAILNVWFWVAFILYEPALQAPWRGMGAYMAMFIPARYLAWAVPAFLIAPAFLIMIACLHAWANEVQRTWSLLALVFALPGATLMAALYYIQMTVVPVNLSHGLTDGLRLWIYAPPYPFTFPGALEGVGPGFEAGAFLLAAQIFEGDRLQLCLRWAFRATGLSALVAFIDPVIRLPVPLVLADGALALILLSAAPLLLAAFWRRTIGSSPAALRGRGAGPVQGSRRSG
jgi:hypothetical protein